MSGKIIAVDRALDILLLLYNNGEEMGISDIGRELELHKSTVHRTLSTLRDKGFIYKNEENDKYWLGIKIYAMGLLLGEKLSLVDIIKPYSKELYEEFHEVVNVSILDEDVNKNYKTIVICKESENRKVLSVNPDVGSSSDAHVSSVGKCLLAYTKNIDLGGKSDQPLKRYTENTITNWDDLLEELNKIKQVGYAIDNEEQEIGLYCIGAPILDKKGNAVAAISMSGPTGRMKNEDIENKIIKLVETANKISEVVKQMR